MKINKFKTELLLMEWKLSAETDHSIIWTKQGETLVWRKGQEHFTGEMITHKISGWREGLAEASYYSYESFEKCLNGLEDRSEHETNKTG